MSRDACPSRERLYGYLVGAIPEAEAEGIARHLTGCRVCDSTARALERLPDPLISALKQSPSADALPDDPQCRQVAERLRVMPMVAAGVGARGRSAGSDAFTRPNKLGDYELLEKLGEGGMGAVYKAWHGKLKRPVALKVLPEGWLDNPEARARFDREMEVIGRLDHPNVVRAMDAREVEGMQFLVMELVEGLDLGELVRRRGPLPLADACELIRQAAEGLVCADEHGLVHRDIKPSNLILSKTGQVKVLDLGLARFQLIERKGSDLTGVDQVMGTPDYISPEQAQETRAVDIRTDIYSLGCTLYKLLCGRAPFETDEYDSPLRKVTAHARDPVTPIETLRLEVPPELAAVVGRMLSKSPADRYSTPGEVAAVLAGFSAGCNLARLAHWGMAKKLAEQQERQRQTPTEKGASGSLESTPGASPQPVAPREKPPAMRHAAPGGERAPAAEKGRPLAVTEDWPPAQKRPPAAREKAAPARQALDPYHRWLSIPPHEQPANHYRLLGIVAFEDDPEVIRDAADRQMAHVRTYQLGPHAELSQQILTELAAARHCLLTPTEKASYDAQLRSEQSRVAESAHPAEQDSAMAEVGPPPAAESEVPEVVASPLPSRRQQAGRPSAGARVRSAVERAAEPVRRFCRTRPPLTLAILGGIVTAVVAFGIVVSISTGKGEVRITLSDPGADVELKVDGDRIEIAGLDRPLVLRPGPHELVVEGPGFETVGREFTVRRGDTQTVKVELIPRPQPPVPAAVAATPEQLQQALREKNPGYKGDGRFFIDEGRIVQADLKDCAIRDLSALRGLPLGLLDCSSNQITDLSPLRSMPLRYLHCEENQITDLSPLQAVALTYLDCSGNPIADLAPLRNMPLEVLRFSPESVKGDFDFLRNKQTLTAIGTAEKIFAPPKFWEWWDQQPRSSDQAGGQPAAAANRTAGQVQQALREKNPGYEGDGGFLVERGRIVQADIRGGAIEDLSPLGGLPLKSLACFRNQIADLSPLLGMPLNSLWCEDNRIADLTPLRGMRLTYLDCSSNQITNLSPLLGMPLMSLWCADNRITDLAPLRGMRLTYLECSRNQITNLSPLQGMPLRHLYCQGNRITDFSPLRDVPLETLYFSPEFVRGNLDFLRGKETLKTIGTAERTFTTDGFWKWWDEQPKAADRSSDPPATAASRTVEEVQQALMEKNPRYKGNGSLLVENGRIISASVSGCSLTDLSPLAGLPLTQLLADDNRITDLSPLRGMPLTRLFASNNEITDLSALQGMPLKHLYCQDNLITDLAPLRDLPLETLLFSPEFVKGDFSFLRNKGTIKTIGTSERTFTPYEFWTWWDKQPEAADRGNDLPPAAADRTAEQVQQALVERNPDYRGNGSFGVEQGRIVQADVGARALTDLWPLAGLPLTRLDAHNNPITTLSPLRGMQLTELNFDQSQIADLSPLQGMPLTKLSFSGNRITDLSPLRGMPLKELSCDRNRIADLSPLQDAPLETLWFSPESVTGSIEFLRGKKTLRNICNGDRMFTADEFWQWWDGQVLAAKRVEQAQQALGQRNPGYRGNGTFTIRDGRIEQADLSQCGLTDLSPLRGMPLTKLICTGNRISDLSPLRGMPLARLEAHGNLITDLSPLRESPLTRLYCGNNRITDLSPLREMSLEHLDFQGNPITDLSALRGMRLTYLNCGRTPITDPSLLRDMPLEKLCFVPELAKGDFSFLRGKETLKTIGNGSRDLTADEFWKWWDQQH